MDTSIPEPYPLSSVIMSVVNSESSGGIIGLIIFFIILLIGGAYFAGAETSLSSVNRIRIMTHADNGSKRARTVLYELEHFDETISTILIGTNIMHIGCASLATIVATRLSWGDLGMTLTSLATTLLVFLISETIPKEIAKACNESFALFVAPSLRILMRVLAPANAFFTKLSDLAKKLLKVDNGDEPVVSEDELHDIIEALDENDKIDEETTELMQSALDFGETNVSQIYTPWENCVKVTSSMKPDEIVCLIETTNHSRLPVVDNDGNIAGVLQIRKYLKSYILSGGKVKLYRVMDKPFYVKNGTPIDEILEKMSSSKTHIALVEGEEGNVLGIFTVEDILEELVGEIYDEYDTPDGGEDE